MYNIASDTIMIGIIAPTQTKIIIANKKTFI